MPLYASHSSISHFGSLSHTLSLSLSLLSASCVSVLQPRKPVYLLTTCCCYFYKHLIRCFISFLRLPYNLVCVCECRLCFWHIGICRSFLRAFNFRVLMNMESAVRSASHYNPHRRPQWQYGLYHAHRWLLRLCKYVAHATQTRNANRKSQFNSGGQIQRTRVSSSRKEDGDGERERERNEGAFNAPLKQFDAVNFQEFSSRLFDYVRACTYALSPSVCVCLFSSDLYSWRQMHPIAVANTLARAHTHEPAQ